MTITSPASVLQQLIRCPSITPQTSGCFDLLQTLLAPLGFAIERPRFSAANTPTVENFYAKRAASGAPAMGAGKSAPAKAKAGQSPAKHLLFAGHIDVVPTGAETAWRFPPFAGQIADGLLYGRGAVDMKGGIACFIAALARLTAEQQQPDSGAISLLLTGDEEGPAINGTVKLLHWAAQKGEDWSAALVGEPSSAEILGDMIKIGRRGSLSAILRVEGKQGHVAYPQRAGNPLPVLARLLTALTSAPLDQGTPHFQPSNLELTSIDTGNEAANMIPPAAAARFNIRFNDSWTIERLQAELENRLARAAGQVGSSSAVSYHLEFAANPASAFITDNKALIAPLQAAITALTGQRPALSTSGGTSDARFIKDYCPVAEFGLVGQTMHQINECVTIEDLENLTEIYRHFIRNYFAGRD
ncbi:succinyl-diaminopimelate desuccinylase [Candidatus Tokpelaia sp.]|uniref:succinyl-diaminopimelate desuccinylase n=1 Tax=Candidatus Tokpelaia sp. TaxID=2233777 RepID=UPI00123B0D42|nr:succinyl-diaminopimelate desuccinylase [Candidatus Tokpelaia sp.]KAA6406303.1 succinyl-diaminopimelate desuccinylase [Candidatus Tokpelaia sp.]